jgi:hypothetical protein
MSIEAMKQAVEAFEHIKKYVTDDGAMPENWDAYHEKEYFALEALRQAIEQAEKQEPVCDKDPHLCWSVRCQLGKVCKNTAPPKREVDMSTKQEKIDTSEECVHETDIFIHEDDDIQEYKRPWVGMSDVEVATYSNVYCGISLARMIEALLKERNT